MMTFKQALFGTIVVITIVASWHYNFLDSSCFFLNENKSKKKKKKNVPDATNNTVKTTLDGTNDSDNTSHEENIGECYTSENADMGNSWVVVSDSNSTLRRQNEVISKMWSKTDATKFYVRGLRYMQDNAKVRSTTAAFDLLHMDIFEVNHRSDHIARNSKIKTLLKEFCTSRKNPYIFIVNLQIPGTPQLSVVMYWLLERSSSPSTKARNSKFQNLLDQFIEADDNFRNSRFKLIPSIVDGPWSVKKLVGTKPTLLGQKLSLRYFFGDEYLEVDVDIGSSMIASQIVSVCRNYAKSLVVDLGIVLQGEALQELPERILGSIRLLKLDLSAAEDLYN